jgi:hypothetical protein
MAKKKTRRQKRDRPLIANDDYAQAIIKALNQVQRGSGRRPAEIFRDWIQLADASLEALPTQLKYVGRTGSPGPDKPETAALFGRIRRWYEQPAWLSFAKAFGILLDSSAAGLHDRPGAMGPDVLGQVYMSWANSDPSWQAQYFTPWNVALLMASITVGNGRCMIGSKKRCCTRTISGASQFCWPRWPYRQTGRGPGTTSSRPCSRRRCLFMKRSWSMNRQLAAGYLYWPPPPNIRSGPIIGV